MSPDWTNRKLTELELRDVRRIDIGCGLPEQKYPDCVRLDVNPDCQPDLLHIADGGLPFTDEQLDFIHSGNSLEHFRNPHFVLRECLRTLRPGGEMLLVVPNCQFFPLVLLNLVYDINKFWHWYMNLPFKKGRSVHFTLYSKHLVTQVAEDVGFQVVTAKGFLYSQGDHPPTPEADARRRSDDALWAACALTPTLGQQPHGARVAIRDGRGERPRRRSTAPGMTSRR